MQDNWYHRHILPTMLDMARGMPMISRMHHYNKQLVTHSTGLDPALHTRPLALQRMAKAGLPPKPRYSGAAAGGGL